MKTDLFCNSHILRIFFSINSQTHLYRLLKWQFYERNMFWKEICHVLDKYRNLVLSSSFPHFIFLFFSAHETLNKCRFINACRVQARCCKKHSSWLQIGLLWEITFTCLFTTRETPAALKSHVNALHSVFKCHNKVSRRLKTSQEVCLLNVNLPAHKLHYLGFSQERFKLLSHFMSR